VARWVENEQDAGRPLPLADVAASFAEAVVDVLTTKTIAACRLHDVDTLVIGGGFSANSQLREKAAARCAEAGIDLRIPPIRYCTDNGAMIAALGSAVVRAGVAPSSLDFGVDSSMPLTTISV
jgi:N6-L-threonylcarbamoyladenine synthase